jgi:hypothetical protein
MDQARKIYTETIRGWQDLGDRSAIAHQLECFALIAIIEEDPQRAARLLGAAESLRERIESQMREQERIDYDHSTARLRSMLAETEFRTLWADGRAMTMEQAIQLALKADSVA